MSVRESFVQHFGEDVAVRVEEAAISHIGQDITAMAKANKLLQTLPGDHPELPGPHDNDDWGDEPFQYLFLTAIARQCMDKPEYREYHGITVPVDELIAWSIAHSELADYRGDIPDYIALMLGIYNKWMGEPSITEEEKEDHDTA